jgi:dihydrofolate reductase
MAQSKMGSNDVESPHLLFLEAGLVDEMHLAVSPVLLGAGEHLMRGIDLAKLGFPVAEFTATEKAAHYVLVRRPG